MTKMEELSLSKYWRRATLENVWDKRTAYTAARLKQCNFEWQLPLRILHFITRVLPTRTFYAGRYNSAKSILQPPDRHISREYCYTCLDLSHLVLKTEDLRLVFAIPLWHQLAPEKDDHKRGRTCDRPQKVITFLMNNEETNKYKISTTTHNFETCYNHKSDFSVLPVEESPRPRVAHFGPYIVILSRASYGPPSAPHSVRVYWKYSHTQLPF